MEQDGNVSPFSQIPMPISESQTGGVGRHGTRTPGILPEVKRCTPFVSLSATTALFLVTATLRPETNTK